MPLSPPSLLPGLLCNERTDNARRPSQAEARKQAEAQADESLTYGYARIDAVEGGYAHNRAVHGASA